MQKWIALCSVILLSACAGWQPLYLQDESALLSKKLHQIAIFSVDTVEERYLYNALLDRQMRDLEQPERYELRFRVESQQSDIATLSDDSAAIVRLQYRVRYTLYSGEGQQEFQSQTSSTYAGDNGALQREVLANETMQMSMEELADTMWYTIANFLRTHPEW